MDSILSSLLLLVSVIPEMPDLPEPKTDAIENLHAFWSGSFDDDQQAKIESPHTITSGLLSHGGTNHD